MTRQVTRQVTRLTWQLDHGAWQGERLRLGAALERPAVHAHHEVDSARHEESAQDVIAEDRERCCSAGAPDEQLVQVGQARVLPDACEGRVSVVSLQTCLDNDQVDIDSDLEGYSNILSVGVLQDPQDAPGVLNAHVHASKMCASIHMCTRWVTGPSARQASLCCGRVRTTSATSRS